MSNALSPHNKKLLTGFLSDKSYTTKDVNAGIKYSHPDGNGPHCTIYLKADGTNTYQVQTGSNLAAAEELNKFIQVSFVQS
ncbi:hypothetical protein [Thorsellia anophelis]|uniref:Uncharacterized protein n=1 Tax=Thorsellia anophelis DSM 18579 TaxID=1123402 RepID=A0A1I0D9J1_9GAMM|nr:hypothetical protein [Thorsellia anophelis]SET28602.1 hypothetical protein SAMN02583745_01900 [Thorsellia anophelis DSM 18579]